MPKVDTSSKATKTAHLNIRINKLQKDIISRAAALHKLSLSEFVIEHSYEAATQILAEKTNFVLPPEKWKDFCDALDSPPKPIPKLRELLRKPSPFNE